MGGKDDAYKRNAEARKYQEVLAKLHEGDPEGYDHWVEIYEDKGHWMDKEDAAFVHELVAKHVEYTESQRGRQAIDSWQDSLGSFVKVMPRDYRRVLLAEAQARAESREPGFAELVGAAAD